MQLINTICILWIYSPSKLKSSLTSHAEISTDRNNVSVQEMEENDTENKEEVEEHKAAEPPSKKSRRYFSN